MRKSHEMGDMVEGQQREISTTVISRRESGGFVRMGFLKVLVEGLERGTCAFQYADPVNT